MNVNAIIQAFRRSVTFTCQDEVELFRELARVISERSNSVFIDETHGKVAQVEFQSAITGTEHCEISDMLIVIKNLHTNEYRSTFWQAKKEAHPRWPSPRGKGNFDFEAQFNQWELLSNRPSIKGLGNFNPHPDLLRCAHTPSIGSFGVFYEDNGTVDVNYSVAEMITASGVSKHPRMTINERLSQYWAWHSDVLVRHDLKSFLEALNDFHIGSLIVPNQDSDKWLIGYIQGKCRANDVRGYINENSMPNVPDVPVGPSDDGDGISLLLINTESDLTSRCSGRPDGRR